MFLRLKGFGKPRTLPLGDNINRSPGLGIGGEHDLSLASNFLYSVLLIECFGVLF